MIDFKASYYKIFNSVTDAVEILQTAQLDGEESYIESKDAEIVVLDKDRKEEE